MCRRMSLFSFPCFLVDVSLTLHSNPYKKTTTYLYKFDIEISDYVRSEEYEARFKVVKFIVKVKRFVTENQVAFNVRTT